MLETIQNTINPAVALTVIGNLISILILINAWVIRNKGNKDRSHNLRKEALLAARECEIGWQAFINKHSHTIRKLEAAESTQNTLLAIHDLKDLRETWEKAHKNVKQKRDELESNLNTTSEKELRDLVIVFGDCKIRLNSFNEEVEKRFESLVLQIT